MNYNPKTLFDSKRGRQCVRIKAAYGTHKALRAQGRVPGAEAREAHKRYARERRAMKELLKNGSVGNTLKEGTY